MQKGHERDSDGGKYGECFSQQVLLGRRRGRHASKQADIQHDETFHVASLLFR